MRPNQMFLRCFAEREGDQWVAMCVDLSLAAQADSLEEAKSKLHAQIREYWHDALCGEDRDHAEYLLTHRKAPTSVMLRYWYARLLDKVQDGKEALQRVVFADTVPMTPSAC